MMTHASTFTPRLRPLAAALATLCTASTAVWESAHAAGIAMPHAPTNIVVGNCNDSGVGSLRAAFSTAASGDTVDLSQLSCSRISLTTGALVIAQSILSINGPGQNALTVDGGNTGAVFYGTGSGGFLYFRNMSIVNGYIHRDNSAAGDASGACVHATASVLLSNVNIRHCKALSGDSRSALGGAVWAQGFVKLIRSTVSDSSAVANGSGNARGGGVYAINGLDMSSSTIADNVASSHSVNSYGGGVAARSVVTIAESTISTNHADVAGGVHLNDYTGHVASIINSTVSGNTAMLVGGVLSLPPLNLDNSTIAFNASSVWTIGYGGQHYAAGVFVSVFSGRLQMHSTIVSNNTNTGAPSPTSDLTGTADVTGANNNVMFCDTTCPADTTNEDPGLHPLQDNGGPTRTHAPGPGPWHRFGGSNVHASLWDQRGVGFPRLSPPDPIEIGAVQTNSGIVFVNGFN